MGSTSVVCRKLPNVAGSGARRKLGQSRHIEIVGFLLFGDGWSNVGSTSVVCREPPNVPGSGAGRKLGQARHKENTDSLHFDIYYVITTEEGGG